VAKTPTPKRESVIPTEAEDLLFLIRGIESEWKRYPSLCHPERSRGICSAPLGAPKFFMAKISTPKKKCHPDRSVPGFPATQRWTRLRARPSVKKGA
jgi:hypothetical protein